MSEPSPTIFNHMERVYDELVSRAALDNGGTVKFEGSKVEAFRAVGVSQGYYTQIFESLTEMGCIEQVRRGAGHFGTIMLLHHRPEYEAFSEIYQKRLTKSRPLDTIQQQLNDMQRRLPEVDIQSFMISLDQRLAEIEARLEQIERREENEFAS